MSRREVLTAEQQIICYHAHAKRLEIRREIKHYPYWSPIAIALGKERDKGPTLKELAREYNCSIAAVVTAVDRIRKRLGVEAGIRKITQEPARDPIRKVPHISL